MGAPGHNPVFVGKGQGRGRDDHRGAAFLKVLQEAASRVGDGSNSVGNVTVPTMGGNKCLPTYRVKARGKGIS